jgi:hypothetical protein
VTRSPGPGALTKKLVLDAQQCARRAWLTVYGSEHATPLDGGRRALIANAAELARAARALFPGGVVVDAASFDEAVARTRILLDDPAVPAIFAAAFVHAGVRIRVDAIERLRDGGWGIRAVKSTARVKERHLDDVAVQRHVAAGAGADVRSVEVIHVDPAYVRADAIEWPRLFRRVDVGTEVDERAPRLPAVIAELRATLGRDDTPIVEPSPHCGSRSRRCDFWAYCTRGKPDDWVGHVAIIRRDAREALRAAAIDRLTDVPDDVQLDRVLTRIRDVLRAGRAFIAPALADALTPFGPPAWYLDFETMNATVPIYPGTRPFEQVPFQWSLHHVDAGGAVTHRELLTDGRGDPRRAVAESLVAALGGDDEPIVVYSSFESQVLTALAAAHPDLATALHAIIARLRDLREPVLAHVYHADFHYSFSLKQVAPALVPGFGYGDLETIAEGGDAARAFARIAAGVADEAEAAATRRALLAYCRRDTEALVELHRVLRDAIYSQTRD